MRERTAAMDEADREIAELDGLAPQELSTRIYELAKRLTKAKGRDDYLMRLFVLSKAGALFWRQAAAGVAMLRGNGPEGQG